MFIIALMVITCIVLYYTYYVSYCYIAIMFVILLQIYYAYYCDYAYYINYRCDTDYVDYIFVFCSPRHSRTEPALLDTASDSNEDVAADDDSSLRSQVLHSERNPCRFHPRFVRFGALYFPNHIKTRNKRKNIPSSMSPSYFRWRSITMLTLTMRLRVCVFLIALFPGMLSTALP
jgi:hypothetical protein